MNYLIRLVRGAWLRLQNPFILRRAEKAIAKQKVADSSEYNQYIKDQLVHTIGLRTKDANFRYNKFIGALLKVVPTIDKSKKVLCIGCRNVYELNAFNRVGFQNVTGVDLLSTDPKILTMDMHDLKFPNNFFDIIYCAATFEKAYDPKKAANEFIRVLSHVGIIILQVGTRFAPGNVDRHDFKSFTNLYEFFKPHVEKILFEEETEDSLATIFQVSK